MRHSFFTEQRPHRGLTYGEYLSLVQQRAEQDVRGMPDEQVERIEFTRLNLNRMQRISRTYRVSDELDSLLQRIGRPQLWMVLTEPWCGDSAQCVPYVERMAARNEFIRLRLLLRDENLDVMDLYLTEGKRGIPKLVAFEADGQEVFRWGPRPRAAQAVFEEARASGLEKPQILEKLHLFYGRDRGRSIEAEFVGLLARLTSHS